ncbi:histone-fold-containing protein [Xylariaceae sp. FL0594]|nr:histone-fold-containing protein [Xylariaceae sp. FL0594]
MPYNTTAIPPRKEVTGLTQLPLSRVKKIVAQDQDINICSNNAAFVITLATEMFIQYLAEEGLNMAKLERKPRRNIQYKDLANAVSHQDNLQFLEDIVPKTVPYKQIKAQAAATRANLSGGAKTMSAAIDGASHAQQPNGKKHKSGSNRQSGSGSGANGARSIANLIAPSVTKTAGEDHDGDGDSRDNDNDTPMDPNEQLQDEMRKATSARRHRRSSAIGRNRGAGDEDVEMEG